MSSSEGRGSEWLPASSARLTISRTWTTISANGTPRLWSAATLARTASRNVLTNAKRGMPARETSLRGAAILFGGLFMGRFGGGKASPVAPETASSRQLDVRAGGVLPHRSVYQASCLHTNLLTEKRCGTPDAINWLLPVHFCSVANSGANTYICQPHQQRFRGSMRIAPAIFPLLLVVLVGCGGSEGPIAPVNEFPVVPQLESVAFALLGSGRVAFQRLGPPGGEYVA